MTDLSRFTSPASGSNIKKLLKDLNDKGAQLRSILWLEQQSTAKPEPRCTCDLMDEDEDDEECDFCSDLAEGMEPEHLAPCQLELSVGTNVVCTELFADQVNQILPFIKEQVVKDLEALERKLNDQGVYLEGSKPEIVNEQAAPSFSVTKRLQEGDICVLLREYDSAPHDINSAMVAADTHVEVTRYYPGELYDLVDATIVGTNTSIQINANHLRLF